MLRAEYRKYTLHFKSPAGTSRGTYTQRESWFISMYDTDTPSLRGTGECAPLPGLSPELDRGFEKKLETLCRDIAHYDSWLKDGLQGYSAIQTGLETAAWDFLARGAKIFFRNAFTSGQRGIPINGLIWMGPADFMREQIREKIRAGYHCIKIKIGALDFETELDLIREIRESHPPEEIEIRLDANGAFQPKTARSRLDALADLGIHSIEQPIMAGQLEELAALCRESPIPIALDEELIGIDTLQEKENLIREIRPPYLVLKPSLHGGFKGAMEWIDLAAASNTGWWITSALESNIGLNAIAQWTANRTNPLPHGLGTGRLFENNFSSPLYLQGDELRWNVSGHFDLSGLYHE